MEVQVLSFAPRFLEISEQLAAGGFLGAPKYQRILGGLGGRVVASDRRRNARCGH